MNAFISTLLADCARPVTLALVHSLWLGSLISIAAGLTLRSVPRARSAVRYAVCILALIAIVVGTAAIGARIATTSPDRVDRIVWDSPPATHLSSAIDHRSVDAAATQAELVAARERAVRRPATVPAHDDAGAGLGAGGEDDRWSARLLHIDLGRAGPVVFAFWLTGMLAFAVYNLAGWAHARSIARSSIRPLTRPWMKRFRTLADRIGVDRRVDAFVSALVDVPTVVGWLRPVLLVPAASLTDLSAGELELVLIHELAHIRRHDILVNYLQTAVETVFFFHPAVWWLSHHARLEREHCCDDAVVRLTGDRIAYARALTEVEMMRSKAPALSMGADGGSLTARIRRLAGRGASHRRSGGYSLTGFLVLAVLAALALPALTGAESDALADIARTDGESVIRGEWRTAGFGDELWLRFVVRSGDGNKRTSECKMTMSADKFVESSTGELTLVRDAGTFVLEGQRFPDTWRPCTFVPNAEYARGLRELSYDFDGNDRLFSLAIHDISLDFAAGIADAGYEISLDKLVEFRIHGVTPTYVQDMASAGYADLTPSGIVEFRIHDVTPEYVREMAAIGYDELSQSKIVQFKIHGISAEYVREMAEIGYDELSASRIVEFSIHDISPEYVREMAESGYDDLSPSRIVEFSIHGVSPEFVRELVKEGYADLPASKLVAFRIHGVDAEYIRHLADEGYDDLTPSEIIETRIHGTRYRTGRSARVSHDL